MSGQEQDKPREVVASLRLPVEARDRLRAQARREHRTLSAELRRIVELSMRETEKDAA